MRIGEFLCFCHGRVEPQREKEGERATSFVITHTILHSTAAVLCCTPADTRGIGVEKGCASVWPLLEQHSTHVRSEV